LPNRCLSDNNLILVSLRLLTVSSVLSVLPSDTMIISFRKNRFCDCCKRDVISSLIVAASLNAGIPTLTCGLFACSPFFFMSFHLVGRVHSRELACMHEESSCSVV